MDTSPPVPASASAPGSLLQTEDALMAASQRKTADLIAQIKAKSRLQVQQATPPREMVEFKEDLSDSDDDDLGLGALSIPASKVPLKS